MSFSQVKQTGFGNEDKVKGYIICKNNTYQQGFIIFGSDKDNSLYIHFLQFKNDSPVKLSDKEIIAYGSSNVRYDLMPFRGDSLFMQKLNDKNPVVYCLKHEKDNLFFIKTESKFELIPKSKNALREYLADEMRRCDHSLENIKKAKYQKKRLKYIFKRNENCSPDRIPAFNYGIYIGVKFNTLRLNDEVVYKYGADIFFTLEDIDYTWQSGGLFLLYFDFPLDVMDGKLSFHPELQYEKSKYDFIKHDLDIDFGFDLNYYTANCFLRYKNLDKKKALFADFGFCYSVLHVSNAYIVDQELFHQLADYLIGVSIGGGVSIHNRFDFGLRSNYMLSHSMPKVLSLNLVIGVEL